VSYIRPDLIIIENVGKLEVTLNDTFLIESLTHKLKTSVKKTSSIKKNEALSFINGLERRQKTLLEVAKFIVSKQEKFLLSSKELLPLSLKQIAKSTGVSESTVSRIVRFKYLQLPNRNIPLSSLLEKKVTLRSSGGKEISPNQLTKLIIKIIKTEKKSEPLSDQKIKKYLQEKYKVSIARRTVAKYRQQAQLLPSRLRN
jgi:RNA polymerase sigma-54 factor